MDDPRTIRYVTERYGSLQGLRIVPLGILFIGIAGWHSGQLRWLPGFGSDSGPSWFAVGLLLAVVAAHFIGAYYRRQFGTVQPKPFRTGGLSLLANAVVIFALAVVQDVTSWPIYLPLVYVGGLLAYVGIVHRGLRKHYLWIATACLLFANVENFELSNQTKRVLFDLLIAGGLILAGVGDHLVIRKVLHSPRSETYVDTTV